MIIITHQTQMKINKTSKIKLIKKTNRAIKSKKSSNFYIKKSLRNNQKYWRKTKVLMKKANQLLFINSVYVLKQLKKKKKRRLQRKTNYEYLKKLKYFNSIHNKYLKNNLKSFRFRNIKIKDFIKYGFHLACKKQYRNKQAEYFYGRYITSTNHSIVNINISIIHLRKGLNFIKNSLLDNARLMLIGWGSDLQKIVPKIFQTISFFKGPWMPGYLSNFRILGTKRSFWYKQSFFPEQRKRKQRPLTALKLSKSGLRNFPNLLFTLDTSNLNFSSIIESSSLRMPNIAFIEPSLSLDLRLAIYPILGTSSTYQQGRFLLFLLSKLLYDVYFFRNYKLLQYFSKINIRTSQQHNLK